ncbi:MAG: right-handed parallel beta-helix repeat-containing protein, partial [bacterium]
MERLKKILWSALTVSMRIGVLIWSALTVSMRIGVLIWSALTVSMQIGVLVLGMVIGTERVEAVDLYVPSGYPTIQAAVNAANSGDRIYVSAGTYNEAVYINKRIALVGVGTPTITVKGLGDTNTVTFDGNVTNNASISGFRITGATDQYFLPNYGIGIYCNQGSPTITNNTISENYTGICCSYSSPFITNNTISGNSWCGILCDVFSSSPFITNNTIRNNWEGIFCIGGSSPTITNNTISGNTYYGIDCCNSSSPSITNNTIKDNTNGGIFCNNSSSPSITNNIITGNGTTSTNYYGIYNHPDYPGNPIIDYNCVWGNDSPTTHNYYNCTPGINDISANPQFIGGADFHLQSTSPCIDKGSNTAHGIPNKDKDGKPRIVNSIVDIGAYEYQGTAPPPSQLEITTNSLLNGQVNYIYSQVLSATGGTAPYSWSKIS